MKKYKCQKCQESFPRNRYPSHVRYCKATETTAASLSPVKNEIVWRWHNGSDGKPEKKRQAILFCPCCGADLEKLFSEKL